MPGTKRAKREARQLLRLCHTHGVLDERRVERLLERIRRDQPRGCLPMLGQFQRLLKLEYAQRTATVESAAALSSDEQARLRARLEQAYGAGLNVSFVQNQALLGGMRVKVGSDVYDGSVQARLAALEARFS